MSNNVCLQATHSIKYSIKNAVFRIINKILFENIAIREKFKFASQKQ